MAKDISSPVRIEMMNELNSDHLPVILHLNEPIELAEQRQHWQYSHANWEKLRTDVDNTLNQTEITTIEDLNKGVQHLT